MLTQSQPVLPLATHKYKEVACPICHFMEDLKSASIGPLLQIMWLTNRAQKPTRRSIATCGNGAATGNDRGTGRGPSWWRGPSCPIQMRMHSFAVLYRTAEVS